MVQSKSLREGTLLCIPLPLDGLSKVAINQIEIKFNFLTKNLSVCNLLHSPLSQECPQYVQWPLVPCSKNNRRLIIDIMINQSINQSTNQPTKQSINQSINQPTNQSINQPTNQPINQPTNQSTNQPINQSINQSINQPVNVYRFLRTLGK